MKNFYRLLNLDSPDATLPEIQQALRNAAQQGTLPMAALRKIRDVLYHAETRRAYNAKLREIEPDFFAAAPKQPAPQKQPASKNSMLIELSGAQFSHLITLYLCGAFSVLLPWVHLGDEPMPGYNVQIIVPLFFLVFAGKLWKEARQKNSIDYITLTLPALIAATNLIRFFFRYRDKLLPQLEAINMADATSLGIGFYAQAAVCAAIVAYVTVLYYQKR
jgi:hypothetical protein